MFVLRRPTGPAIGEFLERRRTARFTYADVGGTNHGPPPGYTVDHNRIRLGTGPDLFAAACDALRAWDMFRIGWLELVPGGVPIEEGRCVAVLVRRFGVWSLNPCRIVYVVDESGPVERFGFAYGTLPGHIERGEERFTVEWNRADGSVWYDIDAFSRPQHPLARIANIYVRRLQRRFACDSLATMAAAVRRRVKATLPC
ncbi:MAG TPA: DUF1990 domain-containing protein [Planctomycetaceae bacterium]|nr:DUF1990 domain-containing protein [Planctomycetaceae bacterium]